MPKEKRIKKKWLKPTLKKLPFKSTYGGPNPYTYEDIAYS